MNISQAFPSNYLKASDIKEDTTYTISDVKMETLGQGKDAEEKPVVYFEEVGKGLVLNVTNSKTIVGLYGDDTNGWTGKPITLFATEVQFGAEMMMSIRIRLRVAKQPAKPATAPAAAPAKTGGAKLPGVNGEDGAKAAFKAKVGHLPKPDQIKQWSAMFASEFPGKSASDLTAEEWSELKEKIDNDYDPTTEGFLVF